MDTPVKDENKSLTLDDLFVGQKFVSAEYKLDADKIKEFAKEFDPQPFHTDEEAARSTFFRGLAASGWHTAAITMRLIVTSLPIKGGLIGAGGNLSWPKPTRPGDTLHVETEIVEIIPSRSRPDRGRATMRCTTLNQNNEPVQTMTSQLVVTRRSAQT